MLGTDPLGRDVFSRLVAGTRSSITVALGATLLALLVGGAVGLVAGYRGGWLDSVSMRIVDVQLAFQLVLLPSRWPHSSKPGVPTLIVILAFGGWVVYARVVRGTVLVLQDGRIRGRRAGHRSDRRADRSAAYSAESRPARVGPGQLSAAGFIISEASLSFLGFGYSTTTAQLGRHARGRDHRTYAQPGG